MNRHMLPPPVKGFLKQFWRFILICADITNSFLDKNGPHLAAAITYYALFSLIPLILAIMFILGTFFRGSESLELRLSLAVNTLVPVSRDSVTETLQVLAHNRAVIGAIGIIGLLWVSTTVFGAIRKGVNTLWGVSRPRRFFHERLIDFAFTAGAGLLMVVPIAITVGLGVLGDTISALGTGSVEGSWPSVVLLSILSPIISFMAFMFIYRYLPNTRVTFRDIWPCALMAAMAFEGWKTVFLWYTRAFPVYDTVYGPVGALVALLTWIYISANILLVGALVTSRYSAHIARKIEGGFLQSLVGVRHLRHPTRVSPSQPTEAAEDD